MADAVFSVVDPSTPAARWSMGQYFTELAARFAHGFDPSGALDEALTAFAPPRGFFVLVGPIAAPIGCGAVQFLDERRGEIKRMWVAPRARGGGIAGRLLLDLETRMIAAHRATAMLDTNGTLTEAIALYEKCGYRRIDRYNDNPYAELWFEKAL